MPRISIDRDILREKVRHLDVEHLLMLLDRAIDLLPPAKLAKMVSDYFQLDELRPDEASKKGLLDSVKAFHAASLRGEYHEDFDVNSRNFMEKSRGTQRWIAECHRLLDNCVSRVQAGEHEEAHQAFQLLLDLLRRIDECEDNIIFFADEGGAWQVGVDWRAVLPAWFKCLASIAAPDEFAAEVRKVLDDFVSSHERAPLLKAARQTATPEQRAELNSRSSRVPEPQMPFHILAAMSPGSRRG